MENQAYKDLKELRHTERTQQPAQKVKAVRKALDGDDKMLANHMSAHATLNPANDNFTSLINALNDRIDAYSQLLAQRRGIATGKGHAPASS